MLYVAIDQHAKQITVAVRDAQGEDVLKRQVSTRPEKIKQFFDQVVEMESEFMAILESCGFNDWLLEELRPSRSGDSSEAGAGSTKRCFGVQSEFKRTLAIEPEKEPQSIH